MIRSFRLTLPAGVGVIFRPLDTTYATTGAKCACAFFRVDGEPFDKEDVQLLATYLLQAIDDVTKAHATAPAAPAGVSVQADPDAPDDADMATLQQAAAAEELCTMPGCTAPKGHLRHDQPTTQAELRHRPTAREEQESDERVDVPPDVAAAGAGLGVRKQVITHEMALASATGTACFYCHELDPSEEHLAKCRALDAARQQVVADAAPTPEPEKKA